MKKRGEKKYTRLYPIFCADRIFSIFYQILTNTIGGNSVKNVNFHELSKPSLSCANRRKGIVTEAARTIDGFVRQIRTDPIIREGYMTFGDIIDRKRREAAREAAHADSIEAFCLQMPVDL